MLMVNEPTPVSALLVEKGKIVKFQQVCMDSWIWIGGMEPGGGGVTTELERENPDSLYRHV